MAKAMKVVDFSFQSIMGKLEKMLAEEAALLAGVEDDVRYIVTELKSITSFLMVMSTRGNLDDQLQNWVRKVREVVYDAEDSIDEFVCRLRSTPCDERGVKGFLKHFLRCIRSLKARHDIASELKKLKVQVKDIRKRHDRYSHPNEASTSSGTITILDIADSYFGPKIISHFVEEAQLVGIDESKDKLIGWVMDENHPELTAISLVGIGGLGKTTLARTVYDLVFVGGHFQPRAWIAVSQRYNIKELLKKIIRQISVKEQQIRDVLGHQDASLNTEQLLNMMDESHLVQTVRIHLHGKRYLLVFDDVWRTKAWESLSIALPTGREGSRVIVITRTEEVANTSCSRNRQFIFKISPLSPEQSWELFCKRVFEAPDYSCPPELENVGREILQKCSGLPLAIVIIGGLLASKPDKKLEEWKDLLDHLRLEIETNDMALKINQILVLSYNGLPYHLKPCFLFLGIFPEDYEIRRKRLLRRWIAEGIVSGIDGFPAQKVAERCFNQLVSRSLVLKSQFDDSGTVKSCRVHDMMLDVILSISRKENFAVLLNKLPKIRLQHQKIRRLSWHGRSCRLRLVCDTDLSHLRSFTAFGEDVPLKDYRKQKLLRAIDLEGFSSMFDLHPKSFSKLFLLKYLSLRGSRISVLPDSIGDLQNLEFLDVRRTDITELPNTIVKLQKLVYLLGGHFYKDDSMPSRIDVGLLKVPKGIGKLQRLAAFGMVDVDTMQSLEEIGELVDLQKLAVHFGVHDLSHGGMPEQIGALLSKLNGSLRSLKILSRSYGSLKMALDEVASPPLLLSKLLIQCHMGELPPWFASLKHVVKISLCRTRLQLEDLRVLRNLPALVNLLLGFMSFDNDDENLVFDRGGFARLKFLEIDCHSVSFNAGAVGSLEILKLVIPRGSVNGIEHLHGLREVHVRSLRKDTIEMVKNIAANHPNRPKCFATGEVNLSWAIWMKLWDPNLADFYR